MQLLRPAVFGFALFAAGIAQGQIRPDAGTILDSTRQPAQPLPQAPKPLLPERSAPQGPPADDAQISVVRFEIEGATVFSVAELQALLADVVGKTVTFAELRAAVERITRHYEASGYFLSRAIIPPQNAADGVIRVRIVDGTYGAVNIKVETQPGLGSGWFGLKAEKAREILAAQGVVVGAAVRRQQLERGLYLLDELPGVLPSTSLSPGTAPGTSDAQINVRQARPVTAQIGVDSLGNRYTGRIRLTGGVGINSPLGIGDRIGISGSTASGNDFIAADYALPIGNDGLRFGINGSGLDYKLCCSFAALGAKGRVTTVGATLSYPFILSSTQSLLGSLGYERRHAVDDTIVGQTADRVIEAATANLVWIVGDPLGGVNRVAGIWTSGRLDLSGNTGNAIFDSTTAQTQGSYSKVRSSWVRVQAWSRHQLLLRLNAQWASKNLDSSEKLSLGGYDAVRAYPQGEAAGDQVVITTAEYAYTLPFDVPGRLQVSAFIDSGTVRLNDSTWLGFQGARATLPNSYSLSGAGMGLNWTVPGNFLMNFNVAGKLGTNPGRFAGGNDSDGSASRTRWWIVINKTL